MYKQGLVKKTTLTATEVAAIKRLVDLCNRHEHLRIRLDWGMLRSQNGTEVNDFLYYKENDLVGYLAGYGFDNGEHELTVLVHPDYRRQAIGRELLEAAKNEYAYVEGCRLVLRCEHASQSGKAFVESVGAQYDFSEHEMVLEDFQERLQFDDRLLFRQADMSNLDALLMTMSASFEVSEVLIRQQVTTFARDPHRQFYLAIFGEPEVGCEEPVGCLRVDEMEDEIGIYAFGIIPDYRGRGYGRQMLEEAIRAIRSRSQKQIMLDVDVRNERALGLYRSCGFQIRTTYDYYNV